MCWIDGWIGDMYGGILGWISYFFFLSLSSLEPYSPAIMGDFLSNITRVETRCYNMNKIKCENWFLLYQTESTSPSLSYPPRTSVGQRISRLFLSSCHLTQRSPPAKASLCPLSCRTLQQTYDRPWTWGECSGCQQQFRHPHQTSYRGWRCTAAVLGQHGTRWNLHALIPKPWSFISKVISLFLRDLLRDISILLFGGLYLMELLIRLEKICFILFVSQFSEVS